MPAFCPTNRALNKNLVPKFGVLKLDKDAAKYLYLYYLIFVKKLANAALSEAFKRYRLVATPEDVRAMAENVCREFSIAYRFSRSLRQRGTVTSSSSSSGSEGPSGISKAGQQKKPAAKKKGKKVSSQAHAEIGLAQAGPSRKALSMNLTGEDTSEESEEELLPAVKQPPSNKGEIDEDKGWTDMSEDEADDGTDTEQEANSR